MLSLFSFPSFPFFCPLLSCPIVVLLCVALVSVSSRSSCWRRSCRFFLIYFSFERRCHQCVNQAIASCFSRMTVFTLPRLVAAPILAFSLREAERNQIFFFPLGTAGYLPLFSLSDATKCFPTSDRPRAPSTLTPIIFLTTSLHTNENRFLSFYFLRPPCYFLPCSCILSFLLLFFSFS